MIFVTAIHGNETIPSIFLADKGYSQIIANIKAVCLNKRFVVMDLNKSFGCDGKSYEEERAREILKSIPENETVIDFHTTSAKTDPFAIIVDLKMLPLAFTAGLMHVVYMNFNIKEGHALINYRNGISIEAGNNDSLKTYSNMEKIIKNLKQKKEHKTNVYEVYGIIEKHGKYNNFEKCEEGFFPVFVGEKSYPFVGLKARLLIC